MGSSRLFPGDPANPTVNMLIPVGVANPRVNMLIPRWTRKCQRTAEFYGCDSHTVPRVALGLAQYMCLFEWLIDVFDGGIEGYDMLES